MIKCERNSTSGRYLVQLYILYQGGVISSYIQFARSSSSKKSELYICQDNYCCREWT